MEQYCHSNGKNVLSVQRCGSYFDGSAPSIPHLFFTAGSAPKLRFCTGSRYGSVEGGAEVTTSGKKYGRSRTEQKSMIDFCIVSANLFSDLLDVRMKRDTELSTDHYLVVCSLLISKPMPSRKSRKSTTTYRIKWQALEDKEVKKQFATSMTAKFRQIPDESEDIEKEWSLFRSAIIASAVISCRQKLLRVAEEWEKRC